MHEIWGGEDDHMCMKSGGEGEDDYVCMKSTQGGSVGGR